MESKHYDRGGRSNSSETSPQLEPPSSPSYSKNRSITRRSPSPTIYKIGNNKTSRNSSPPQDIKKRRKRSTSRQRYTSSSSSSSKTRKRSRSRDLSRSRKSSSRRDNNERDRSRCKITRGRSSKSRSTSRSRSRSKSRDRYRHRERDTTTRRHYSHSRRNDDGDDDNDDDYDDDNNQIDNNDYENNQIQKQIIMATPQPNAFKNDGSFMEMFKKMQEKMQPVEQEKPTTSVLVEKTVAPPLLMVGKRRGGRILKTGMVAKQKTETTVEQPKDAWSLYMAEVKKYREVCCQEEDNTRPLVK